MKGQKMGQISLGVKFALPTKTCRVFFRALDSKNNKKIDDEQK